MRYNKKMRWIVTTIVTTLIIGGILLYTYPSYIKELLPLSSPIKNPEPTIQQPNPKKEQTTTSPSQPSFIGPTGQPFVIGPSGPPPE